MSRSDEGFIQSSLDVTTKAAEELIAIEYGAPHKAIEIGASVPARVRDFALHLKQAAIKSIEMANSHEILVEQHASHEYITLQSQPFAVDANLADGDLMTVSPANDPAQLPGRPEFDRNTRVFYVNGIRTSAQQAAAEGAMLAGRMHHDVELVYVKTNGVESDVRAAFGETMSPMNGRMNPPEKALAREIEKSLDRGENVHIVGYSRGALVTQLALENVCEHYIKQGHDQAWVERNINSHITVETFNGASHRMPPGVDAEHYVSKDDFIVANTIGMGVTAPAIRQLAAHSIDSALAMLNEVPPDRRLAVAADLAAMHDDIERIEKKVALSDTLLPVVGVNSFGIDIAKLSHDLSLLLRDGRTATPGADELARDGLMNQPNGPIHVVGTYLDVPDLQQGDAVDWLIEQHDLPGMLPSRHGHATKLPEIGGNASSAEKALVGRAVPIRSAFGGPMPMPTSVSVWDGTPQSGTVFDVDGKTFAMHVGKGEFVTIAAERFVQGPPPNNSYIALHPGGTFVVEHTGIDSAYRDIKSDSPQHGR